MGSRERPLFDLNELPTEEEDEKDGTPIIKAQKSLPTSNSCISSLFQPSDGCPHIINNHAFKHASSSSGFQPFVRCKGNDCPKQAEDDLNAKHASTVLTENSQYNQVLELVSSSGQGSQAVEKEEGEWSDMEDDADALPSTTSNMDGAVNAVTIDGNDDYNVPGTIKVGDVDNEMKFMVPMGADDCTLKGDVTADSQEPAVLKHNDVKGVESSHAMRSTNNPGKRPKFDGHKEAMLGKKRARQTVFINLEDAKQAGSMKILTPKRQPSLPARVVEDTSRAKSPVTNERSVERQNHPIDQKHSDRNLEGSNSVEFNEQRSELNCDVNPGSQCRNSKLSSSESPSEVCPPTISKQGSSKHSMESRHINYSQISSRKPAVIDQNIADPKLVNRKHLPPKKPVSNNLLCQDTSVERLIREVTNVNFWHHKEETELQSVPGSFKSVEEYVSVFEPLLFEECRAQLYSTWEECNENSKDPHTMVHVKTVERRERGSLNLSRKRNLSAVRCLVLAR